VKHHLILEVKKELEELQSHQPHLSSVFPNVTVGLTLIHMQILDPTGDRLTLCDLDLNVDLRVDLPRCLALQAQERPLNSRFVLVKDSTAVLPHCLEPRFLQILVELPDPTLRLALKPTMQLEGRLSQANSTPDTLGKD